jgi:tight adherence protein B
MTLTTFIIGSLIAFAFLLVGIVISIRSERTMVNERLGRYVEQEKDIQTAKKGPKQTPLTDWINTKVERSSFGDSISKELARADLKLKPGEYVAVIIIAMFGFALVGWYIGQSLAEVAIIPFSILGSVVGFMAPRYYVRNLQSKRLNKFSNQLGDMLNLMVNGLRAGFSTMQAMEAVSKELPAPISDEFRRVVQEMQLGVNMETALDNLLRRIPSDDLDLMITAINVQREVGGNLAEILDTISFTIRERVRIKGEIRVMTTQVMYSGRFLAMLPLIVMGILYLLNREYMMEFFNPKSNERLPCGYIGLGLAAILIVSGYFAMNKLGEVEI